MKLATLRSATSRDGQLVVVSPDHSQVLAVPQIAPSLREAVENWPKLMPQLERVSARLANGQEPTAVAAREDLFHSPLPRAFQWADGSAFLHHVKLVRMARKAPMPEKLYQVPLMYQGG